MLQLSGIFRLNSQVRHVRTVIAGMCPTPLTDHCWDGVCYVTQCLMCPTALVSFSPSPLHQRQHNLPSCHSLSYGGLWEGGSAGWRPAPPTTAVEGSPPSQSRAKHMSSGATGVWEGGWRSPMYRNRDREGTSCATAHGMPILSTQHWVKS